LSNTYNATAVFLFDFRILLQVLGAGCLDLAKELLVSKILGLHLHRGRNVLLSRLGADFPPVIGASRNPKQAMNAAKVTTKSVCVAKTMAGEQVTAGSPVPHHSDFPHCATTFCNFCEHDFANPGTDDIQENYTSTSLIQQVKVCTHLQESDKKGGGGGEVHQKAFATLVSNVSRQCDMALYQCLACPDSFL